MLMDARGSGALESQGVVERLTGGLNREEIFRGAERSSLPVDSTEADGETVRLLSLEVELGNVGRWSPRPVCGHRGEYVVKGCCETGEVRYDEIALKRLLDEQGRYAW